MAYNFGSVASSVLSADVLYLDISLVASQSLIINVSNEMSTLILLLSSVSHIPWPITSQKKLTI